MKTAMTGADQETDERDAIGTGQSNGGGQQPSIARTADPTAEKRDEKKKNRSRAEHARLC